MKKILIMLSLAFVSWGSYAQHDHSHMDSKKMDKSMVSTSINVERNLSTTAIIDNFLILKDALTEDNSIKAANAGSSLLEAIVKFNVQAQDKSRQKELGEILENASEQAKHISKNGKEIGHQREHFEVLSTDIRDLVLIIGSDRNLYQHFCPMYNNGKGVIWLSSSDEIKNPYYGSKMLKCGSVQQEIIVK